MQWILEYFVILISKRFGFSVMEESMGGVSLLSGLNAKKWRENGIEKKKKKYKTTSIFSFYYF